MIRAALILMSALWATLAAAQEEVVLGLSQNRVQINARFDGSEILIFGAVKRETPIPETPLEVIVTVAGPSTPVTVHRKDRVFGIWVNAESVEIARAPSFYAVAASGPITDVRSHTEDLRHSVTVPLESTTPVSARYHAYGAVPPVTTGAATTDAVPQLSSPAAKAIPVRDRRQAQKLENC